ncbi:molybdopterin molybdotransferase MoeA [Pelagibacteraceae bacterium]|nr:molybdopterin molybdotransferase MoeA [Pelagibacteraceae bacterium]
MISYEKALKLIKKNVSFVNKKNKLLTLNAVGYCLAEDIYSNIDIPPQNNSAVDGYAFNYKDYKKRKNLKYKVRQEINAGDKVIKKFNKNECVKVSTGAHLPKDLDIVVMTEDIKLYTDNTIKVPAQLKKKNIRKRGEDVKKGSLILRKNTVLRSQEIGMLCSLGKNYVKVFNKIAVGLLSNGNELVNPGTKKHSYQIYDSNRYMISSMLNTNNTIIYDYGILKDNYEEIKDKILSIKKKCNLIIISGGASLGEMDFIVKIVKEIGKLIFSGVSIKPGRPFSFGLLEKNIPIVILPGNPVASFVTFNLLGRFLIKNMLGNKFYTPNFFLVKSNFNMKKKVGRDEFLRGKIFLKDNILFVNKYKTEGAGILSSTIWANGLIRVKSNQKEVKTNDYVEFYPYESFT